MPSGHKLLPVLGSNQISISKGLEWAENTKQGLKPHLCEIFGCIRHSMAICFSAVAWDVLGLLLCKNILEIPAADHVHERKRQN